MDPATIKSYFDKLQVALTYAAKKQHFLDPIELKRNFEKIKISVPQKKEGQQRRKLQFDKKDESLERYRDRFFCFKLIPAFIAMACKYYEKFKFIPMLNVVSTLFPTEIKWQPDYCTFLTFRTPKKSLPLHGPKPEGSHAI